jgi:hypothetical protein
MLMEFSEAHLPRHIMTCSPSVIVVASTLQANFTGVPMGPNGRMHNIASHLGVQDCVHPYGTDCEVLQWNEVFGEGALTTRRTFFWGVKDFYSIYSKGPSGPMPTVRTSMVHVKGRGIDKCTVIAEHTIVDLSAPCPRAPKFQEEFPITAAHNTLVSLISNPSAERRKVSMVPPPYTKAVHNAAVRIIPPNASPGQITTTLAAARLKYHDQYRLKLLESFSTLAVLDDNNDTPMTIKMSKWHFVLRETFEKEEGKELDGWKQDRFYETIRGIQTDYLFTKADRDDKTATSEESMQTNSE